jgi:hypothetical protein
MSDRSGHGLSGLRRGLCLLGGKPLRQCHLCCLSLVGHLLPEGLLVLGLTEHGLGGVQTLGSFLMGREALFERLAEAGKLSLWGLRGDEGGRT